MLQRLLAARPHFLVGCLSLLQSLLDDCLRLWRDELVSADHDAHQLLGLGIQLQRQHLVDDLARQQIDHPGAVTLKPLARPGCDHGAGFVHVEALLDQRLEHGCADPSCKAFAVGVPRGRCQVKRRGLAALDRATDQVAAPAFAELKCHRERHLRTHCVVELHRLSSLRLDRDVGLPSAEAAVEQVVFGFGRRLLLPLVRPGANEVGTGLSREVPRIIRCTRRYCCLGAARQDVDVPRQPRPGHLAHVDELLLRRADARIDRRW